MTQFNTERQSDQKVNTIADTVECQLEISIEKGGEKQEEEKRRKEQGYDGQARPRD
jgi:hypothetical protein